VKSQVYIDPRPAELFDKYHKRVRERGPDWVYSFARVILTPTLLALYRAGSIGTENVPEHGPVILAPNHFSNFDHFFLAVFLRRQVQFMAKSQLYKFPIDFILSHGGAFPVLRGKHDEEAFVTAHTILDYGGIVGMYAEGGRSRKKELGKPKPGLGRLALESGVPVIPVAIHGSEHVRDRRLPKVTIQYGQKLLFEHVPHPSKEQALEASQAVFDRVRDMYGTLREKGRRGVLRALREEQRRRKGATQEPLSMGPLTTVHGHGTGNGPAASQPDAAPERDTAAHDVAHGARNR
jgi:1-acyl-sn-glycerol-3-phosphate acyltransferase